MNELATKSTLQQQIIRIAKQAKQAAKKLAMASTSSKQHALQASANAILAQRNDIVMANQKDLHLAKKSGQSLAFLDRLTLDDTRIEAMAKGLSAIAKLADPVGKNLAQWDCPNGLQITRYSTPLGVIGVIYEARPNVTADAAGLCLYASNATILRCGRESLHSASAIIACIKQGLVAADLPIDAVQLIPTADRLAVTHLLQMDKYIDVIVPRGGQSLIEKISQESKIPLFKHLAGLCHTYIHEDADFAKARRIVINAKMRRPGICGATETLLIDKSIANIFLPQIIDDLIQAGCEVRGDQTVTRIDSRVQKASDIDWDSEYLDAIIAIRVVDNLAAAIAHIDRHGSQHTEAIITENKMVAEKFCREIDSAIVMHNTSTQFADGGEFGMGAEIGIATGKLHARGPVGVEQLTTFKYIVQSIGQVR